MQHFSNLGIEEQLLLYAINPAPGQHDDVLGARPAADIASLGMGFDIVGGCHVSPNVDPEVFEKMEVEDEETQFRLFDPEEWIYRNIPVSELTEHFPDDSAFDADRVATRVADAPGNAKYRFQKLVNSERQALAAADLRSQLESGKAFVSVSQKGGVTPRTQTSYQQVREAFIQGREQTALDEF